MASLQSANHPCRLNHQVQKTKKRSLMHPVVPWRLIMMMTCSANYVICIYILFITTTHSFQLKEPKYLIELPFWNSSLSISNFKIPRTQISICQWVWGMLQPQNPPSQCNITEVSNFPILGSSFREMLSEQWKEQFMKESGLQEKG